MLNSSKMVTLIEIGLVLELDVYSLNVPLLYEKVIPILLVLM